MSASASASSRSTVTALPQLDPTRLFMCDGGMETSFIFLDGITLPEFASFTLLDQAAGVERLKKWFDEHLALARSNRLGIILDTPGWRASKDWGDKLKYTDAQMRRFNQQSIELLVQARKASGFDADSCVISGCVGPRGDGYVATNRMSPDEAEEYHSQQIGIYAEQPETQMITAYTLNYIEEAIGIARAAKKHGLPVAISFTVETDGKLPSGPSLKEAIKSVDAATGSYPAYYLVNCAHPTHFVEMLKKACEDDTKAGDRWLERLHGAKPNASKKSHSELNECPTLDAGEPKVLGGEMRQLKQLLPHMNVFGGCCGTDVRHIKEIVNALTQAN